MTEGEYIMKQLSINKRLKKEIFAYGERLWELNRQMRPYHHHIKPNWRIRLYDLGTGGFIKRIKVANVIYDTEKGVILAQGHEAYDLTKNLPWAVSS